MATFLDISILGNFIGIFTFLLVFVIIYGSLEMFNIFGQGRRGIHSIIALAVGFIVIFSSGVVRVIQTFMPWFTLLIIIVFFILFATRMFGLSGKQITDGFYNNPQIMSWIIIMTVVILLFSLGSGFGQQTLDEGIGGGSSTTVSTNTTVTPGATNTSSFSQNLYNTLYHPKILGVILIFLIIVIAMLLLTSRETS